MNLTTINTEEIYQKISSYQNENDHQQYPVCTCYYGCLQKIFDKPVCHHYSTKKNKSKHIPSNQKKKISLSFKKRNSNKKQQNPHSKSISKKENHIPIQRKTVNHTAIHVHTSNELQSLHPTDQSSTFKFFKPKQKFSFENLLYSQNVPIKPQARLYRNTSYMSPTISFKKQTNQTSHQFLNLPKEQSNILKRSVESTQCSYLKNLQTDSINFDKPIQKEKISIPSPMIYSQKQSESKNSSVSVAVSSNQENQQMKKISWGRTRDKALTFFDQNVSDNTIQQYSLDEINKFKKYSTIKADSVFGVSLKSLYDKSIKKVSSIQDSLDLSEYSEVISKAKIQDRKASARILKQLPNHKRKSSYVKFSELQQSIYDDQFLKFHMATK